VFVGFHDVAHQGFHQVVEGDDALNAAKFIGNQGVELLALAEKFQHIVTTHGFWNELGGLEVVAEAKVFIAEMGEKVLEEDDANNVVQLFAGDRVNVVNGLFDDIPDFIEGVFHVKPNQVVAVSHQGIDVPVAQVEDSFHDVVFHQLNLAVIGAFLQDGLDFIFGDFGCATLGDSKQFHESSCTDRQKPDKGGANLGKEVHGGCNNAGHFLGIVHGNALWKQFAKNECQIGDSQNDESYCNAVGCGFKAVDGNTGNLDGKPIGNAGTGKKTGEDTNRGDADLDCGKEFIGRSGQVDGLLGFFVAASGITLQPGSLHGDQ